MELQTLKDLYLHELKDLFSAEQQLVKALPKMAKAASNKELAAGFQEHLEQTRGHAQRLEQILSSHKATTRGPKCKGMELPGLMPNPWATRKGLDFFKRRFKRKDKPTKSFRKWRSRQ